MNFAFCQNVCELILCKRGIRHKAGAKCAVHKDEHFSMRSDLGTRRLCAEKYVTDVSTVISCDVTYCATTQVH